MSTIGGHVVIHERGEGGVVDASGWDAAPVGLGSVKTMVTRME